MSLCRLVFDGGGPTADYLPARHGQLFDPEAYPWLETPWISDGVVLAVLRNLLIVNGERISYRALDVEQIGSVYEGIMGYAVRRIPGRCIGLKSKPQGAKKQLTTAVDLDALLALPGGKRKAWLEEEAGTTLPAKSAIGPEGRQQRSRAAGSPGPAHQPRSVRWPPGSRRPGVPAHRGTAPQRQPLHAPGAHPADRGGGPAPLAGALRAASPRPSRSCDLKICDPAMGSGAFLVESCRYLAELLEQAWDPRGSAGCPEARRPRPRRRTPDLCPPADRPELPLWGRQEPVCGEPGPPQPLAGEPQQGRAVHLRGSRPQVRRFAGGHGAQRDRGGVEGRQPAARTSDRISGSGAPAGGQELRAVSCRQPQRCRRRPEAPGPR